MSDFVIKDFDAKARKAGEWFSYAVLAFTVAMPFYAALNIAVMPAADLLTDFAKDNGATTLSGYQRVATYLLLLPATLLFTMASFMGYVLCAAIVMATDDQVLDRPRHNVLRFMTVGIMVYFAVMPLVMTIFLRMLDVIHTNGIEGVPAVDIFANVPTNFLLLFVMLTAAYIFNREWPNLMESETSPVPAAE